MPWSVSAENSLYNIVHFMRSNGLVDTKTPEETEFALMEKVPKKYWLDVNDTFVMYGQNICKPISPMCGVCKIRNGCKYYKTNSAS